MNDASIRIPAPRTLTIEDVHRMVGAMSLEIEMLRRENAELRKQLEENVERS